MPNKLPRPLHDRVLVRRTEEVAPSVSDINVPDTSKEKPQQGIVLAVGNGLRDSNGNYQLMDVCVNDLIMFGKYSGQPIKVNGEDLLIMREEEVFCILDSEPRPQIADDDMPL